MYKNLRTPAVARLENCNSHLDRNLFNQDSISDFNPSTTELQAPRNKQNIFIIIVRTVKLDTL